MKFAKKLKLRLYMAIVFLAAGLGLILFGNLQGVEMATSFGAMLLVLGIARIVQYRRIHRTPETFEARQVKEEDERNVMLWTKARALAFSVYIIAAALGVIVLYLMEMDLVARTLALSLFGFVLIYWVCYFIISQKN